MEQVGVLKHTRVKIIDIIEMARIGPGPIGKEVFANCIGKDITLGGRLRTSHYIIEIDTRILQTVLEISSMHVIADLGCKAHIDAKPRQAMRYIGCIASRTAQKSTGRIYIIACFQRNPINGQFAKGNDVNGSSPI